MAGCRRQGTYGPPSARQPAAFAIVQVEGAALLLDKEPGRVAANLKTVHEQLTAGLNELCRITKQIQGSNGEAADRTLAHKVST